MHFVNAKGILSGSGERVGMNIYRGCTHGCVYCDSRSRCYGFTHDFEDIEVKRNAPELLEQALRTHTVAEPGSIKVLDKATVSAAAGGPRPSRGRTATCYSLWDWLAWLAVGTGSV